MTLCNRICASR